MFGICPAHQHPFKADAVFMGYCNHMLHEISIQYISISIIRIHCSIYMYMYCICMLLMYIHTYIYIYICMMYINVHDYIYIYIYVRGLLPPARPASSSCHTECCGPLCPAVAHGCWTHLLQRSLLGRKDICPQGSQQRSSIASSCFTTQM